MFLHMIILEYVFLTVYTVNEGCSVPHQLKYVDGGE